MVVDRAGCCRRVMAREKIYVVLNGPFDRRLGLLGKVRVSRGESRWGRSLGSLALCPFGIPLTPPEVEGSTVGHRQWWW